MAGKMDMALDDVIKMSRPPKVAKGKGAAKEGLGKAAMQKNKAQRKNKVAEARGMDVDPVSVPIVKSSKKNLKVKAGVKVKKVGAAKKAPAKQQAGGATKPVSLASMLSKPVGAAGSSSGAKAPAKPAPAKGAAGVTITITNPSAKQQGGRGGKGKGRGAVVVGGGRGRGIVKPNRGALAQKAGKANVARKVTVAGVGRGGVKKAAAGKGGRGGRGGRGVRVGGTLSSRFGKK